MKCDFKTLEQSIADWNRIRFPDADLRSQLKKLYEELVEFNESGSMEELADVFIANAAVRYRFKYRVLAWFVKFTLRKAYVGREQELFDAIVKKMEKNKVRVFEKLPDGSWHHVGED